MPNSFLNTKKFEDWAYFSHKKQSKTKKLVLRPRNHHLQIHFLRILTIFAMISLPQLWFSQFPFSFTAGITDFLWSYDYRKYNFVYKVKKMHDNEGFNPRTPALCVVCVRAVLRLKPTPLCLLGLTLCLDTLFEVGFSFELASKVMSTEWFLWIFAVWVMGSLSLEPFDFIL